MPGALQRNFTRSLAWAALAATVSGCAVGKIATGKEGEDMSAIRIGVTRAEVERRLGEPVRYWISEHGVPYAVYEFDKGVPPRPDRAALGVVVDVITLGMLELLFINANDKQIYGPSSTGVVIVAYGKQARVIGLFNEFDKLPPDGRATVRPSVLRDAE